MISLLGISHIVILRLAAREPAHINGCGPVPKKIGHLCYRRRLLRPP